MQRGVKTNVDARLCLGWSGKEGDTYPGGDATGEGNQNHSPHYHSPHYAETDPLMDHTHRGQVRSGGKPEWCGTKDKRGGRVVWQGATQHAQHTQNSRAKTVSLAKSGAKYSNNEQNLTGTVERSDPEM